MRTQSNIASGMVPEEALEAALLRFGDYERIKQSWLTRSELAQQVFERYIRALGGREAWGKISSRTVKGTFQYDGTLQRTPGGFERLHGTGDVEMYWKGPNKVAEVLDDSIFEAPRPSLKSP